MKRPVWLCALLLSAAIPAHAVQIAYDLESLGGNGYRYTYTVTNDGTTGGAVELFDVLFDPALYDESSLTIATNDPPSSSWDQIILASGLSVPAAYDALSLTGGIPIFGFETGFKVEFQWLGADLPGAQGFAIYDPVTFDLLESGNTTVVPLPGALPLFLSALGGIGVFGRKRART